MLSHTAAPPPSATSSVCELRLRISRPRNVNVNSFGLFNHAFSHLPHPTIIHHRQRSAFSSAQHKAKRASSHIINPRPQPRNAELCLAFAATLPPTYVHHSSEDAQARRLFHHTHTPSQWHLRNSYVHIHLNKAICDDTTNIPQGPRRTAILSAIASSHPP